MKLARRPYRHPPETIIALIDVVFFLLVFFMLIGRMDASAPFEVSPAIGITGADMPGGGITLAIAGDGALALDGVETSLDEAAQAIAARRADEPEIMLRINADRDAELRQVLPVIADLEADGARNIVLVITPKGS